MKHSKILAFVFAGILFSGCKEQDPVPTAAPEEESRELFVEGRVNVLFDAELAELIEEDLAAGNTKTKSDEVNSLVSSLGIESMRRLFPHAGRFEERTRREGLHRWYAVTYSNAVTKAEAETSIAQLPGVLKVEPVRRTVQTAVFNDTMLGRQWHFINDGSLSASHKEFCDINVERVWTDYTTGSSDVIVAVVDGGIDYSHEDLADNYAGGFNFVTNDGNIVPEEHGTHVAGTIAARSNNGKGVAGIAGGDAAKGVDGVKLLSCQVFMPDPDNPKKTLTGSFSEAIKWGADHGAVISQNSWAYVYSSEWDASRASISQADKEAIDYFIKYAGIDENGNQTGPMKGGVVIFAAGNSGFRMGHPASYEPVVAVAAVAADFSKPYYTNYGSWVDICAPGGNMTSANEGGILSTILNNSYGWQQGSSMACPHVSGVAALLVSHFGGPGFTNEMLKERLLGGANASVVTEDGLGPMLDALGSFVYGTCIAPEPVKEFKASTKLDNVDFEFTVTADEDDGRAYSYIIAASADKALLESFDGSEKEGVLSSRVLVRDAKVGDTLKGRISGLSFDREYYLTVIACDYAGNRSKAAPFRTVTPVNNPPAWMKVIDDMFFNTLEDGFELDLNEYIYDPDEESLVFSAVVSDPSVLFVNLKDSILKGAALGNGSCTVTVKARDCRDESLFSFDVIVKEGSTVSLFPNPVRDVLNVSSGLPAQTSVKVISSTGLTVVEAEGISGAFDPLRVDMSGCAPGRYTVKIIYDGVEYTRAVVKL